VSWRLTADLDEYLALAGPFLAARPVEHTLLLSVTDTLRRRGLRAFGEDAPLFGWWVDDGGVAGAFLHTPPWGLVLTALPPAAVPALVDALARRSLPSVNGEAAVVSAFAAARGGPATVKRRERLYRLGKLVEPQLSPPGRAIPAAEVPRELLVEWVGAFQIEIGESADTAARVVDNRLDGLRVWERDGAPVCLAGATPPVAGTTRIGPVYTPPGDRGRGYAGALTAAVCREALATGVEAVALFADVDNATSTGLYTRLGFAPLQDRLYVVFD
jgi:GNAT superfamily N-acetyltransferase